MHELFDLNLDYSRTVTTLSAEKDELNASRAVWETSRANLAAAVDYLSNSVVSDKLASVVASIAVIDVRIASIDAVLAEIASVQALGNNEKDQLYYFYTIVGANKPEFMARMLFNYQAALTNPDIIRLNADTVTPRDSKIAVATAFYESYTLAPQHISVITVVYRTV